MWEHAGLICFILNAHRSVLPTKLLHSISDRSSGLHNALALYRPRQKLPFYYLIRRSSQHYRLCMSVVSAILQVPRQCTCFCPRGACKHYLSAHTLDGNKHGRAISLLLPSLITSITRLRHGTAFSMIVDTLNQVSLQGILVIWSLWPGLHKPPADRARFSHHLSACKASNLQGNTMPSHVLILWWLKSFYN